MNDGGVSIAICILGTEGTPKYVLDTLVVFCE